MSIKANVVDGQLQYNRTDSSKKEENTGNNLGYDQFLQLLCAEMQYQDPLEPTSNTDYVAQLATFSQLEATLSMENTQQGTMANDLVGKQVILKETDDATGKQSYIDGRVDYVMYQDGEIYLSVNNNLYPMSDLDTVADSDYYEAVGLAKTFNKMVTALPEERDVTTSYKEMIQSVRDMYDDMTDFQKNYLDTADVSKLTAIEKRLNELVKAEEAATNSGETEAENEENKTEEV